MVAPQNDGRLVRTAARIHCDNAPPGRQFIMIKLGFLFRQAGSHKRTDEADDPRPGGGIGKYNSQGSPRDGGTYHRNNSRQDAQTRHGSETQAPERTCQGTFRSVRLVLATCKWHVRYTFVVTHGDADLGESSLLQFGDGLVGVDWVLEDADNR
jgi:hypothetical protein